MRAFLIRLSMLAVLTGIWLPLDSWLAGRERIAAAPVTFRFQLPFEESIRRKYGLPAVIPVKEVILTGRHADWLVDNTNFRMRQISPTTWTLSLAFRPGRHPYKFVVRPVDPFLLPKWAGGVIWSHDKNAAVNVDDNFKGQNSVLVVEDATTIRELLQIVFAAAVILVGLHWLLAAVVRLLLRRRFSLRWKLVLVYAVLLVMALVALFSLAERQKRSFAIRAATDKINMLHALILGEGVRWAAPIGEDREDLTRAKRVLTRFFSRSTVRYDFHVFSNTAQPIVRFFLLAPDGRLAAYLLDRSAAGYYLARNGGSREKVDIFHKNHIRRIFAAYKAAMRPDRFADPWTGYWSDYLTAAEMGNAREIADHDRKTAGFRHDTFLMPVYADMVLRGYYLVGMNPESYAAEFARHRSFAWALSGLVGLLFLLIVLDLGRCLLRPLTELHAWTEAVAQGDVRPRLELAVRRDLAAGDEIGGLTANFDRMQASLAAHLDGLTAVNALTGVLPRLRTEESLYRALLSFLVAPFGFNCRCAAVFLSESDAVPPVCRHAAGSAAAFGPGAARCTTLEEYVRDPCRDPEDDSFRRDTLGVPLPERGLVVNPGEQELLHASRIADPAGRAFAEALHLESFMLFPVPRGAEPVGQLLVDGLSAETAAAAVRGLQILLNEFAVTLENAHVLANLEGQVAARTAELTSALERLSELAEAERFAAVGKLLAGVAHEVFNPLSAIRAPLDVLERSLARGEQPAPAIREEAFAHMRAGLQRVEQLIKGLRDLFTKRDAVREKLDLAETVAPFVELARARAAAGVVVDSRIPPGIIVEAGRDALAHLVTNLLANAVDAVGKSGTVVLDGRMTAAGIPELVVADNGAGLDPGVLPRLFDPFWTTKEPGQGTGLGLFLVKDIARKYGWVISAASPGPGQGATFTILFGGSNGS